MSFCPPLYAITPRAVDLADPSDFTAETPKTLFLGGLLHLSNVGLTAGLANLMHGLLPAVEASDKPQNLLTLTIGEPSNIPSLAAEMHQVAAAQRATQSTPITENAQAIVSTYVLPPSLLKAWKALPAKEAGPSMDRHFQNIRLIGYSYGTSLVQQIECALRQSLSASALPLAPLEKVRAVNIGPVALPGALASGQEVALTREKALKAQASFDRTGRFDQLFVFRHTDKVMSEVIGGSLLAPAPAHNYEVFQAGAATCVGEYCGDEMLRYMAVATYPSGFSTSKITYNFDHEGHALRLYANVLSKPAGRCSCVFPSSNMGWVLQDAMHALQDGRPFGAMPTIGTLANPVLLPEASREATAQLTSLQNRFGDIVENYRASSFADAIPFVRGQIEKVGAECARAPQYPSWVRKSGASATSTL